MKIKSAVRYNMSILIKQIAWFVFGITAVYGIVSFIFYLNNVEDGVALTLDMSVVGFLFVLGLMCYIENLKTFLQNGLSRKTLFVSLLLCFLGVSMVMAVYVSIPAVLNGKIGYVNSLLYEVYKGFMDGISMPIRWFYTILCYFMLLAFSILAGIFFAALFSRLSKTMKIFLPVGFGLLIVILFWLNPVFDGAIGRGVIKFFMTISGMNAGGNINYLTAFFAAGAAVWATLIWLIMRRATLKE